MNKKIKVILVLSFTVVAGVGIFLVLINPAKPANISEPTNDELIVQLGLDKNSYSIGELINFKSFIKNPTATEKSYTFNTTCTGGRIYIDEQPTQISQACGAMLSNVYIGNFMTVTYEYPFTLVDKFSNDVNGRKTIEFDGELKLPSGQHQAKLKWQGFESNILTFSVE